MSERLKRRIGQLKFISTMFKMAMDEFNNVMGPETIQTIFRLIGERQGEIVEKRLRETHKIDKWTPDKLSELLVKEVIDPAVGEGKSEIKMDGNEIIILIKACPFKTAGIEISNKFFCTYTEGLIETIAKNALNSVEFNSVKLKSEEVCDCTFSIKVN